MFDWYLWVGLPLLVFFARIADVTLGTLRIIFTSRGKRKLAPLLGFVEVFIWVSVISEITRGAHNLAAYLAYAAGFAAGTYIGMFIEDKLALGMVVVRAILPANTADATLELRARGYGFTRVEGQGSQGAVQLIYVVVSRKSLAEVIGIIQASHPNAFYTVEELRSAAHGVFPASASSGLRVRKGK
ncbi:MAG: DUF5698 domain-containing protein [Chloroflexi bacterium]|nr:DUF5698 domain-containing protein [Chloroflexota bacterium]